MQLSAKIAEAVRSFSGQCQKKTDLWYKLIKTPFKTRAAFDRATRRPLTLIPFESFAAVVDADEQFKTLIPGDAQPEMIFKAVDVVGRVLVIGAVGEIYHAGLGKFTLQSSQGNHDWYAPVQEQRVCTPHIDNILFHIIRECLGNRNPRCRILHIPTSWGATHIVKRGDVLILDGKGVYRVQGHVFDMTYNVTL